MMSAPSAQPYRDAEHLCAVMRALFAALQAQPGNPVDALARSRLVIRLDISAPSAGILIDGRARPTAVYFDARRRPRPDLDVRLRADTLHRILLDELSLKEALARKQVSVRGPLWKARALAEIFTQGRKLYPTVLQSNAGLVPPPAD